MIPFFHTGLRNTHQLLPLLLQVRHLGGHQHAKHLVREALVGDHEVEKGHLMMMMIKEASSKVRGKLTLIDI